MYIPAARNCTGLATLVKAGTKHFFSFQFSVQIVIIKTSL